MPFPFCLEIGKLNECDEVLLRTCCTKYTSTQSCPSLNKVHNKYHPIYFSRTVKLRCPLLNLRVQGMVLLLLQGTVVLLLMQGMVMGLVVLLLLM